MLLTGAPRRQKLPSAESAWRIFQVDASLANRGSGLDAARGRGGRPTRDFVIDLESLRGGSFPAKRGSPLSPEAFHAQTQFRIQQQVAHSQHDLMFGMRIEENRG